MARSEVSYTYDADTAFRAPGLAGVTASGEIGVVALDAMVNAREGDQKNKLGGEFYDVVIAVEASVAGTAATYTFDVEIQDVGGGNAATAGALEVPATVPGQYVIKLDGHTLEKLNATRGELALNLTLGGTGGDITFSAWLAYGSGA
jgi:hypothetical protein